MNLGLNRLYFICTISFQTYSSPPLLSFPPQLPKPQRSRPFPPNLKRKFERLELDQEIHHAFRGNHKIRPAQFPVRLQPNLKHDVVQFPRGKLVYRRQRPYLLKPPADGFLRGNQKCEDGLRVEGLAVTGADEADVASRDEEGVGNFGSVGQWCVLRPICQEGAVAAGRGELWAATALGWCRIGTSWISILDVYAAY